VYGNQAKEAILRALCHMPCCVPLFYKSISALYLQRDNF